MAAQLKKAMADSIWIRVDVKTLRARRSALRESATSAPTWSFSRSSAAWERTVVRLAMVSAITPVAREWASENSFSAATTRPMRRCNTKANTATSPAITSATGQATIPRTTMAPIVVTLMRRMPQTVASIMSAKAHVDVSSVAMTSPDGLSVCQEWLRLMRCA